MTQLVRTVIKQELTVMMRSKWIISFALLFALLSFMMITFGGTDEGSSFTGFNRLTASMLNSSLFLVPLLSLMTGAVSLSGEKEDGHLKLLLTYPVSIGSILTGKYIGMLIGVGSAVCFGFGISGVFLFQTDSFMPSVYFLFFSFTLLLASMFLAVGFLIGMISKSRLQALGLSLFAWAGFVLFYEFIVMGLLTIVQQQAAISLLTVSVLLNPAELIRVWTIVAMNSASIFGPHLYDLTVWSESTVGQLLFILSVIAWIILPLACSYLILNRGVQYE
ncbi:ABC transporter permease subunit [Bacillus tianshenii]|nr:ABC transporter permease subunit [Bacillus tianshenii]